MARLTVRVTRKQGADVEGAQSSSSDAQCNSGNCQCACICPCGCACTCPCSSYRPPYPDEPTQQHLDDQTQPPSGRARISPLS